MNPMPGTKPSLVSPKPAERSTECPHVELLVRQLLARLRIAVVYGGDKAVDGAVIRRTGNPRSWKSYESVARDIAASLRRLGCNHVVVLPDDMRLAQSLQSEGIHLAWLNTGGVQGTSAISHAPALLEMLGIPYVGHDPLTAAALDNKFFFKRQVMAIGIPTSPFVVWHPATSVADPARDRRFQQVFRAWDGGFIVKPITGRASLHVHFVERASDLRERVREVYEATRNHVLIEA
jgi:D-alanine-D-alanine ligase